MKIDILRRVVKFLSNRRTILFKHDIAMQTEYLRKIGEPKDDIDRSYFQYSCQKQLLGKCLSSIYEVGSFIIFGYFWHRLRLKPSCHSPMNIDLLFLYNGSDNIIPDSIKSKRDITQIKDFHNSMLLTLEDLQFFKQLNMRYPRKYYFKLKSLLKIAIYSFYIQKFSPKGIIVSEEYSFTSSLLTEYCGRLGIEHINVMHGEKLFDITDAFFHFHSCYIWDETYKTLFLDLHAESTQFIIENPVSILSNTLVEQNSVVDFTYYLGSENLFELLKIRKNILILKHKGYVVIVRPHPLHGLLSIIQFIFSGFIVEDVRHESIQESIARTRNVISLYSTVLRQAKANGKNIIIDDVSFPLKYKRLAELRYNLILQPHDKLSDYIA